MSPVLFFLSLMQIQFQLLSCSFSGKVRSFSFLTSVFAVETVIHITRVMPVSEVASVVGECIHKAKGIGCQRIQLRSMKEERAVIQVDACKKVNPNSGRKASFANRNYQSHPDHCRGFQSKNERKSQGSRKHP